MASFLPINLNIKLKNILIIGGGSVALQKIGMLKKFTDNITVIGIDINSEVKNCGVKTFSRKYKKNDLKKYDLIYACTNDRIVNQKIKRDANKYNILVNVVDDPALCDFITPAIYKQDNMSVSVSSDGLEVKRSILWRNKIKWAIENDKTYNERL